MKLVTATIFVLSCSIPALAQATPAGTGHQSDTDSRSSVNVNARNISSTASEGNNASVTVGGIGDNADVQGVSVINGKVWIDGKEVPPSVKQYKNKAGTFYRIHRANDGSVSVSSE